MSEEVIEIATKTKKKKEKPENFIGWKSPDGKLEIVGIADKTDRNGRKLFKVTCAECFKDLELFPDGYFISTKGNLVRGQKPCGCARSTQWEGWQYLILAKRAGEKKGFIVNGFAEEFKNAKTKLNLECLKDGHKWTASINEIVNGSKGCPECAGNARPTEQEALQKCIDICKEMGYAAVGFVNGYKNQRSRFEYTCKIHGKQNVSYTNFVNNGRRCNGCSITGYSTNKQGSFYIIQWTKDNRSFIKFGITNQKELSRVKTQKRQTEYKYKKIWSATFDDGSIPLHIENYIKNSGIEVGVISKEEFPDGFTETINTDNLHVLECLIIESVSQL